MHFRRRILEGDPRKAGLALLLNRIVVNQLPLREGERVSLRVSPGEGG